MTVVEVKVSFSWIARQCSFLVIPLDLHLIPFVKYAISAASGKTVQIAWDGQGSRFSILFCLITYASSMVGLLVFWFTLLSAECDVCYVRQKLIRECLIITFNLVT